MTKFLSSLRLSKIPLYMNTTFRKCGIYHLSVVGHLGYFQRLAIVNNAAINIGVLVSLL
jgi:hypothetical protein